MKINNNNNRIIYNEERERNLMKKNKNHLFKNLNFKI